MKKKLTLSRETLRSLSFDPLDRVNGGASLGPACSAVCGLTRRSSCCDSGDTGDSCNVFSCASCLLDTCGCDTNWPC
jgi:hypothetical protein